MLAWVFNTVKQTLVINPVYAITMRNSHIAEQFTFQQLMPNENNLPILSAKKNMNLWQTFPHTLVASQGQTHDPSG